MTTTDDLLERAELKPNLTFDYVPIKEVNVGNQHKDWLRTESFLDIVSELLQHEDVKKAGGFMVIRPKNYRGAQPYMYPQTENTEDTTNTKQDDYDPKAYDLDDEYLLNLHGIPNLKQTFRAQIHDQSCKAVKEQLFKWNNPQIYAKQKSMKQQFEANKQRRDGTKTSSTVKSKSESKDTAKKKKKKKHKHKNNESQSVSTRCFDVITDENGMCITQTQSGRIIKMSPKSKRNTYEQLDKYLDAIDKNKNNHPEPADEDEEEEEDDEEDDEDVSMKEESDSPELNENRKRKRARGETQSAHKKRKLHNAKINIKDGVVTLDYSNTNIAKQPTTTLSEIINAGKRKHKNEQNNALQSAGNEKTEQSIKTRKVKLVHKKRKYQYPFELKASMPEPDDDDNEDDDVYKLQSRDPYTASIADERNSKRAERNRPNYQYPTPHDAVRPSNNSPKKQSQPLQAPSQSLSHHDYYKQVEAIKEASRSASPAVILQHKQNAMPSPSVSQSPSPNKTKTSTKSKAKPSTDMHINRGFACVIQQIERPHKKTLKKFWKKEEFVQHLTNNIYDTATPEEIPLIFADYLKSANKIQYAILDEDDVYHYSSPLQLQMLSRYGPFSVLKLDEQMLGIEVPYVYIGQQHAFFPFHREDMNLFAVNHLLWGCDKLWYCIQPKDHARVISFVRKQFCSDCAENENLSYCETPLQHKLFWFDPYILLSMGIRVFFIRQQPGDIVITPPGGIHGGLNAGPNMAESINFMTYDIEMCWKPVLGAMLYYMHNHECDVCITHAFIDVNRLAKRLREQSDEKAPDTKTILPPLQISKKSNSFPSYKNADRYISRSFTWADRQSLQSRYINSHEYVQFRDALSRDMVYPCYQVVNASADGDDDDDIIRVNVYPVTYEGEFKHRRDEIMFEPLYHITYLHDDKKADEHVALKQILTDEGIVKEEWNGKFRENSAEEKLREIFQATEIAVTFSYKPKRKKKKKKKKKQNEAVLNSSERRKKIKKKRVIRDSDTESD